MSVKTASSYSSHSSTGRSFTTSPRSPESELKNSETQTIPTPIVVNDAALPSVEERLGSAHAIDEEADSELGVQMLRYDPEVITAYYSRRPLQVGLRLFGILFPFLNLTLKLWWDRRLGQVQRNQRKRAVQLRNILTRLGPAFIKIGQALSTRPDLVPPTYLDELTLLQDQLPPFPNEVAFQFIEEELGDRPEAIYAELTASPIAAASLGQVYRGKLKTGEEVAVKVQRPGLAESIAVDMYILRQVAKWAMRNIKQIRSDLVGIMDEFASRIFEEMDYTHEGQNAERFARLYGHLKDVYVPRIYWEYTGRRVLTMEWVTGTKLTQPEALRAQGI
jgi:predicted unusual protein kinase regulating ubiquinone biosynthesis (AarF/ABC1/UbiB family)